MKKHIVGTFTYYTKTVIVRDKHTRQEETQSMCLSITTINYNYYHIDMYKTITLQR